MDPLRQQQQQQHTGHVHQLKEAKELAKLIGALGRSISEFTNTMVDVDPEQWALNCQSLNYRLQESSRQFQQYLETYVREATNRQTTEGSRQFTNT